MRIGTAVMAVATIAGCAGETPTPSPPTPQPTVAHTATASPAPAMRTITGVAIPYLACLGDVSLEASDIRVFDEGRDLIALGSVGERDGTSFRWHFTVEVPDAPFYFIEVGAQDQVDQAFTAAELDEEDSIMLVANPPGCE